MVRDGMESILVRRPLSLGSKAVWSGMEWNPFLADPATKAVWSGMEWNPFLDDNATKAVWSGMEWNPFWSAGRSRLGQKLYGQGWNGIHFWPTPPPKLYGQG